MTGEAGGAVPDPGRPGEPPGAPPVLQGHPGRRHDGRRCL